MKDKLFIEEDCRGTYRIMWHLAEEGFGASLGDYDESEPPPPDDEHRIATDAARTSRGCQRDFSGLYWDRRADASVALKAANAALKNRPLADWEQRALAAGWKPPKGRM